MRECPDCKVVVDDEAQHCPQCGKAVPHGEDKTDGLKAEIALLLTSAAEHRITKNYEKAASELTEALRLAPKNTHIMVLLADLYDSRDMLDEAMVWYRTAVEIDPSHDENREKLAELSARLRKKASDHVESSQLSWLPRNTVVLALSGVLAILLLILVAAVISKRQPANTPVEQTSVPQTREQSTYPGQTTNIPQQTEPRDYTPTSPGIETSSERAPKTATITKTQGERAISEALTGAENVSAGGGRIEQVTADPRDAEVRVTFTVPRGAGPTREAIIKSAAEIARLTFESHREPMVVTVRCMLEDRDPAKTQIGFVGDISREQAMALPDNPAESRLLSAFSNMWWNPLIRE